MRGEPAVGPLPASRVRLRAGDEIPAEPVGPLSRTDFVRYAGASGDLNPIHHDEPLAIRAGLPSVLGIGMLQAGLLGNRLARWVGPENLRSFAARFTGQVWPGDQLTMTGHVVAVEKDEGEPTAEIVLSVVNQEGTEVIRGRAVALVAVDGPEPSPTSG